MDKITIEYLPVDELTAYKRNARKHGEEDVSAIVESIKDFGFNDPIGIWSDKNVIVEGHGRLLAAKLLGLEIVPCIRLDYLTDEQRRGYALAHNKTAELSKWDDEILKLELEGISIDMSVFGFDIDELGEVETSEPIEGKGSLRERYLVPPFSVIYGNKQDWLARKRGWVDKGIRSELGREGKLVYSFPDWMDRQSTHKKGGTK